MRKILSAVAICIMLAGCTSAGNESIRAESSETLSTKVTKGKTTKAQVKEMLGDPSSVSFTDSGNEIWTYKHDIMKPKAVNFVPYVNYFVRGADVDTKSVVILFNKSGIVQNYTLADSKQEVRQGLGAM